jgi:hypothetical protein
VEGARRDLGAALPGAGDEHHAIGVDGSRRLPDDLAEQAVASGRLDVERDDGERPGATPLGVGQGLLAETGLVAEELLAVAEAAPDGPGRPVRWSRTTRSPASWLTAATVEQPCIPIRDERAGADASRRASRISDSVRASLMGMLGCACSRDDRLDDGGLGVGVVLGVLPEALSGLRLVS